MKTWRDFVPLIAMEAPGCPQFEIEDVVQRMAIEFYEETRAWRVEDVALGTTVQGQPEYAVTNPANAALAGLPAVWIGGVEVPETSPGSQDDLPRDQNSSRNTVHVVGPATIRLSPAPDASARAITATVAYKPAALAAGIDDEMFRRHQGAIRCKVLAHLLMQPGKPWTDPKMAGFYASEYATRGCDASTAAGPLSRTPLRVRNSKY